MTAPPAPLIKVSSNALITPALLSRPNGLRHSGGARCVVSPHKVTVITEAASIRKGWAYAAAKKRRGIYIVIQSII